MIDGDWGATRATRTCYFRRGLALINDYDLSCPQPFPVPTPTAASAFPSAPHLVPDALLHLPSPTYARTGHTYMCVAQASGT